MYAPKQTCFVHTFSKQSDEEEWYEEYVVATSRFISSDWRHDPVQCETVLYYTDSHDMLIQWKEKDGTEFEVTEVG